MTLAPPVAAEEYRGSLKRSGRVHEVSLPSMDLREMADPYDGLVSVSVEVPRDLPDGAVRASVAVEKESGGFVTIRPNGTYQSSMRLVPIFGFQQVDQAGNPIGEPIVVDTGKVDIPGFPFWLASDGGRWTDKAPSGRLVTPASSNFFYDTAVYNRFIHSNGPPAEKADDGTSQQLLGGCLKLNAEGI